jgi:hypothetical protein
MINTRYYDRRTMDRYLDKGLLKETELKKHMDGLKDDTDNAQWVQMDLHDAELSEDRDNGSGDNGADEEDLGDDA